MTTIPAQPRYSYDKAERLEVRLSHSQKTLIQRAADLQGRSLTDFVISCLQLAAKEIIREHEMIALSAQESEKFANHLLGDAEPNAALRKAKQRHQRLTKDIER